MTDSYTPPGSGKRIAVIGAGPAGLMAAEQFAQAGLNVEVFDAMPSVARKFLLAGIGGMNITHSEDYLQFVKRYRSAESHLRPALDAFKPDDLRAWIHGLGIETFVGTSGRVFPKDMKAAPLLRSWLKRLRDQGIVIHTRHRWTDWARENEQLIWEFTTPDGKVKRHFDCVVLALGGASWPKLGSDGSWVSPLSAADIAITPLQASNCGFEMEWSDFMQQKFAGTPLKQVALSVSDSHGNREQRTGEFIISAYGVEGSLVYALSNPLRDCLNHDPQNARLILDWLPNTDLQQVEKKLREPRKGMSFANVLHKKFRLPTITNALLQECYPSLNRDDANAVASALKAMPMPLVQATRPIDEAISSAGGIQFSELDSGLMLKALPGVFVAGEMLDWDAPTGGYLLTACFATGRHAGRSAVSWLKDNLKNKPKDKPKESGGIDVR